MYADFRCIVGCLIKILNVDKWLFPRIPRVVRLTKNLSPAHHPTIVCGRLKPGQPRPTVLKTDIALTSSSSRKIKKW